MLIKGSDGNLTIAHRYAASSDTRGCVRVVAVYGNDIVLYSVPADALRYSTAEQENSIQSSDSSFQELETLQTLKHPLSNAPAVRDYYDQSARFDELNMKWVHYLHAREVRLLSLDDVWPLRISGSVVGSIEGIVTLCIQDTAEEGLTVWAFSKNGVAKGWTVDDSERPVLRLRSTVDADGVVEDRTVETVDRE